MYKIGALVCLFVTSCSGMELSLEEKVGQLLMAHFHGEVANDDAKMLIQDVKVGGIIYYTWANGLQSPENVKALSAGLQQLTQANQSPIPLLIAADQEGGVVARLQAGFTEFPGNRALGATGNPYFAQEAAFIIGQELRSVGINMNLAPVVDVNSNPANPVIGIRSFGEDPESVTAFGEQSLKGYSQAKVIATLKHFPGHGDASIDSHEELPVIHKTIDELNKCELYPFAELCASADAIMTAHILVPALDPENCSTLSSKTLTFLREGLGFNGAIVSDSLVMQGVLKKCHSIEEASILALNAGCDLLILGGKLLTGEHRKELTPADVQRVAGAIVEAVKSSRISEARVDAAVEKVLALKKMYQDPLEDNYADINSVASREVAQKIAAHALKVLDRDSDKIAFLQEKHLIVIAPKILQDNIEKTSLLHIGKSTDSFFYTGLRPLPEEIEAAKQLAKSGDVILVCSYNAWKNPAAIELIQSLKDLGKPWILLCARDPKDVDLFPEANLTFISHSPTWSSIQTICDRLLEY